MLLKTEIIVAPDLWAPALINGDYSGLDTEECALVRRWIDENLGPNDSVIDCDGEQFFTWSYDLHSGDRRSRGGTCTEYTVVRHET